MNNCLLIIPRKFRLLVAGIVLSVILGPNTANAQLFQDAAVLNLVKKDIDCIYNQQFENEREIYAKIKELYPGHPVVFLLRGLSAYWRNYPMLYTSPDHIEFEKDMRQCIRLSEKSKYQAYQAEYLLANLCAKGMLIRFYDDNERTLEVIPLVMSLYKHMRASVKYTGECADLYYYTGAYNFYREAYPDAYPAYKTLAFLLPRGSVEKGLKELQYASEKSIVLKAESYSMLASIYLNFQNKYEQSGNYSRILHEMYPDNMLYSTTYIKNLLLLKQYEEAEKLAVVSMKKTENKYFRAQLMIQQGILQEKRYRDYHLAQRYYKSGISMITPFGDYGNEYTAYAYFGLSRISTANNDRDAAGMYRKKALRLGNFKKTNFDK